MANINVMGYIAYNTSNITFTPDFNKQSSTPNSQSSLRRIPINQKLREETMATQNSELIDDSQVIFERESELNIS